MAFQFYAVLVLAACSASAESQSEYAASPAHSDASGAIKVSAASRPYVVVKPVGYDAATAIVRAPARVAFRDGAVSRLDTPVPGRVTEVRVKTGDHVKAGDPLVVLSSPDAAATRATATAATVELDAAQHELARQDQMAASGVGIESERLAAKSKLRQLEAEVARARTTSALLGAGDGSTIILRAPIDGTVIARKATVGSVAQPGGDSLIELGNPNALWVIADVFERDVAQVQEGAEVDVELSTRTKPAHGKVVTVGSALTGSLRTAPVYIALDDDLAGVRPGMYARALIKAPADGRQHTIVLPAESVLVKDGKKLVVYVRAGDDRYTPREVAVGPSVDGMVQVLSGLAVGDQVVVKGALLVDGAAEQLL